MTGRKKKQRLARAAHGLVPALTAAIAIAMAGGAHAQDVTYRQFTLGVLDHDVHFLEGKEGGVDINPEFKLESPISDAWTAQLPWYLRYFVQPRPTIGGEANTAGFTNEFYFGGTWTWQLAQRLLSPDDGITFGIFWGPGFNDGLIVSNVPDRKSLGSHVLYREALELGYQINSRFEVSVFIDHVSNAGSARYNQSINDAGGRFSVRF
jgi:lipid A 3-O-deacylase